LKKSLDEDKKEMTIKNERIEIMDASLETMAKLLIQMDISGHPPIPTGSSWQFLSLAIFFLIFGS